MKKVRRIHLVLKREWFDMVERGEKLEEYRELKDYWTRRLGLLDEVVFHRGYTSRTITFQCLKISIGIGREEWGAPPCPVYIISLGARI